MTRRLALVALLVALAAPGCPEGGAPARPAPASSGVAPEIFRLALAGEIFELELALDPRARRRGLGGRSAIASNGGMLFVFPAPETLSFVMRDCLVPIDVAFLDAEGRVVAIHEMSTEPPRRADESRFAYERRLHPYPSEKSAQFAVETAGGRLAELGLRVGDRLFFDAERLARRAR